MERHYEHKRNSGSFWAYVLIIVGILWLLKKSGWDINLPSIGDVFSFMGQFFSNMADWSHGSAVPILLLIVGIMLIAGRRFFGALLFVILLLIILPHFLILPGILIALFFPLILIIIGIIILTKLF
ncbi:MAG: hypothetical protein ACM3P1_08135 [Candidatus Saccharibacteria bacterium]